MDILTYFIAVNVAWLVGYAVYILCRGVTDTFFVLRRALLLGVGLFSLTYVPMTSLLPPRLMELPIEVVRTEVLPVVDVMPGAMNGTAVSWWVMAYIAVALVLLFRIVMALLAILRLVRHCQHVRKAGHNIYFMPEGSASFTFFNRIFLPASMSCSPQINAVLAHEVAHARQLHSVDLLFLQVLRALLWCNPALWLTLREMRALHEYLADEAAAGMGGKRRQYQLALLAYTAGESSLSVATPLIHKFNVLPLKKRIKMLNTPRSSRLWRMKYLLLLPVGISLLHLGSSEGVVAANLDVRPVPAAIAMPEDNLPDNSTMKHPATYPGGETALMMDIAKNIRYPEDAAEKEVQGRVMVQFTVNTKGDVCDVTVVRSLSPSCDAAAVAAVKRLRRFQPARQNGRATAVKMQLPLMFRLQ